MSEPRIPIHGQRRFWAPVELRYFLYSRPERIDARCDRCNARIEFLSEKIPQYVPHEQAGGYVPVRGEIGGTVSGRGACSHCGRIVRSISWPSAAYFKVNVPEGIVWAWNGEYLPLLRARVQGDRVTLRHLTERNWDYARFVSRLPRYALVTKNRARILAGLAQLEKPEGES